MTLSLSSKARRRQVLAPGLTGEIFSVRDLADLGFPQVSRLPLCLQVILESLLRKGLTGEVGEDDIVRLASWQPRATRDGEIPFHVGRIVLQDIAGIPLLGDLAMLRQAVAATGLPPELVSPAVPVDMVIDHTVSVDYHGSADALAKNMRLEMKRNDERFRFVKWAMQAMPGLKVIPPGFGILHQINLEFLSPGLLTDGEFYYPDTLVGTDSHTCMISGLGVVGWGVGGIEADAAILGEPVSFLTPDVVGVRVTGKMLPGVTATDLVLQVTQLLRQAKVVGKFVEFFGDGLRELSVPDRATVANMAPEYGATIAYFPVDQQTIQYLRQTGRPEQNVVALETYFRTQGWFGGRLSGDVDYTEVLELDLSSMHAVVAGPKRPQDVVVLPKLKSDLQEILRKPAAEGGYDKAAEPLPASGPEPGLGNGSVVIAAITSCTNTSNPRVMITAGLLARNARRVGLKPKPWVKTSLAPGSVAVSGYLQSLGLQDDLDALGFSVVGFGCATCIGNSGALDQGVEAEIKASDLVVCAALSGNRNFEGRIHPLVRAAYLMSPPLVVAFALAGRMDVDLTEEPIATASTGQAIFLRDIWPEPGEVDDFLIKSADPALYRRAYSVDFSAENLLWADIETPTGPVFPWDQDSAYLKLPPFVSDPDLASSSLKRIEGARPLAVFGNSITTDHISPVSGIRPDSPAGRYLSGHGVSLPDLSTYGARRMNHDVMMRGAFANPRLRNLMTPGMSGNLTVHHPSGEEMTIFDASVRHANSGTPLVIVAGDEYGTGSARDWAAKGTRLLGVRAVLAKSFERIHRSNLVGMGVLPLEFGAGEGPDTLGLNGSETFAIEIPENAGPRCRIPVSIHREKGASTEIVVTLRADTAREIAYLTAGGILPFIFGQITSAERMRDNMALDASMPGGRPRADT